MLSNKGCTSAKEQNELREKRKLNLKRLKAGLLEFNEEKGKDYKIAEERIQGSMAMHTITQNDKNDYDIDVGVVFESENHEGLGPLATEIWWQMHWREKPGNLQKNQM